MSVAAYTPTDTYAAPMQAIIHDGSTPLLISPVRWIYRDLGPGVVIEQGIWLLPTQADGSAWTWDAIRSHWFGVEYNTAAAGNPGAALDDLYVYHVSFEVWYNDVIITNPNPPQSRRPPPVPQMCA